MYIIKYLSPFILLFSVNLIAQRGEKESNIFRNFKPFLKKFDTKIDSLIKPFDGKKFYEKLKPLDKENQFSDNMPLIKPNKSKEYNMPYVEPNKNIVYNMPLLFMDRKAYELNFRLPKKFQRFDLKPKKK